MKVTPDDYGRRCQFDHFCKLVLYHEAVDYFRERKRQRGWETSFETLPLSELDTLCTIDQYPSDSFIFPAYGCELQISDGPNMTVIITSCILFFLGSATVKGFAFSLGLGVAVSMFTAITVSRTLLMFLIDANWIHNPWWFGGKRGYDR